jgi:hypothetical protein
VKNDTHNISNNSQQSGLVLGATNGKMTPESIKKFKDLYLQEFGIELTENEAVEIAEHFLSVARVVMQPMPKSFLPRYKELLAKK